MLEFDQFAVRVAGALGLPDDFGRGLPVEPHAGLFDDLALDSLQSLQLLLAVESISGIDVPPREIPELYTLGDAFDYYLALRGDDAVA